MAIEVLNHETDYMRGRFEAPQGPDRSIEVLFNNPARALTYLIAATNPAQPHTPATLGNELGTLQGTEPGWRLNLSSFNAPRTYADTTLIPAQLFDATTTHNKYGKIAQGYKANDQNLPFRIAVAATALDWELQFPHLKLSHLLGDTRLRAEEAKPLTCLKIFESLLEKPDSGSSLFGVVAHTGRPMNSVNRCLTALTEDGILTKHSKYTSNRPLRLSEPGEHYKKLYRQRLGEIGTAIYDTVIDLTRQGVTSIDSSAFMALVTDSHSHLTPMEVWDMLIYNPPKPISFADDEDFDTGKHTRYTIQDGLRPAIEDLVLRYQNLQANPAFVEAAVKRAYEILNDPAAVAFLMRKAKPNSDAEPLPRQWIDDPHAVLRARIGSLTLQRLPIEPRWEQRSQCRALFNQAKELDDKIAAAELFFPPGTEGPSQEQAEAAERVCRKCPARVAASCLQWALDTGQQEGVFGGLTPKGRRKYRNKRPKVDALQINPTRPRTNAEASELLENAAIQNKPQ